MAYYSSDEELTSEVREVRVHGPLYGSLDLDNDWSCSANEPGKLIVLKFFRLKHLLVPVRFRIITR